MDYEVIFDSVSRWFDDYERAVSLAEVTSCEYGKAILRDWADGYIHTYANGAEVECTKIIPSDDPDNDWEEPWEDLDDPDNYDYEDLEDDYDEPYDPFDEVGYDPYTGGYDIDL